MNFKIRKNIIILIIALVVCICFITGCSDTKEDWDNTKNINKVEIKSSTEWDSDDEMISVSKRNIEVFKLLEQNFGGFICDTNNYDIIDGKERYKWVNWDDEENQEQVFSIKFDYEGHCISVSKNYFDYNKVLTINNNDIREQLKEDTNTVNILVPEKYKNREQDIINIYRDYMMFNNVEVANIYTDRLGLSKDTRLSDDFNVNIIYVKNDQKYFSFKPEIAVKSNNYIEDCIVIVLSPETIHPVQMYGVMTRGLFSPMSTKNIDSEEDQIKQLFLNLDSEDSFFKLKSVYSTYREHKQDKILAISIIILVAIIFTVFVLLLIRKVKKVSK